jgi:hypothetical protein
MAKPDPILVAVDPKAAGAADHAIARIHFLRIHVLDIDRIQPHVDGATAQLL